MKQPSATNQGLDCSQRCRSHFPLVCFPEWVSFTTGCDWSSCTEKEFPKVWSASLLSSEMCGLAHLYKSTHALCPISTSSQHIHLPHAMHYKLTCRAIGGKRDLRTARKMIRPRTRGLTIAFSFLPILVLQPALPWGRCERQQNSVDQNRKSKL